VQSWLQLSPHKDVKVDAIACQNDTMAMGTLHSFEEIADPERKARLLSVPFFGCDGVAAKGQAYIRQGWLKATIINPPLTGVALEMLAKAMHSQTQPPELTLVEPASYPALETLRSQFPTTNRSFSGSALRQ
jgi:ABC-type sugar transport system substrate-binding protein